MNRAEFSLPIASDRRVWLTFERAFKKRGAALLHQQCGLWGHDVRRVVAGQRQNALLELGFTRTPPPPDILGATTYARRESDGASVTLWGFGMRYEGGNGAIFLSRFAFSPHYCGGKSLERAWMPSQLRAAFSPPRRAHECVAAFALFHDALRWIAAYEREVEACFGPDYRECALRSWAKAAPETPAPDVAGEWEVLAASCAQNARFRFQMRGQKCDVKLSRL